MIKQIVTNIPKLEVRSEKIHDPARMAEIVADLIDTASHHQKKKHGCVGLAANQIGELYRIFVIWHESKWIPMINPEVTLVKSKITLSREGCLSRPGVNLKVRRNKKIDVVYWDLNEDFIERRFTGFTARVVQHELDHLNGIHI